MKTTYNEFLKADRAICSGLEFNTDAKRVFEFLSEDNNIIKMIEYSELGRPALEACVEDLEKMTNNTFSFDIKTCVSADYNKKSVGRMIKSILKPFGYEVIPNGRKAISKRNSVLFTSASCYKFDETAKATLAVKKVIVEL